jgi:hypothetical protein
LGPFFYIETAVVLLLLRRSAAQGVLVSRVGSHFSLADYQSSTPHPQKNS